MAWEDRTPFDAIEKQFNVSEAEVIKIMRSRLKKTAFRNWRKRVNGRQLKHTKLRGDRETRHRCPTQGKIRPKPR